jgi:hypothetical protein
MYDFYLHRTNAIENQIIVERTPADAEVFMARHQRIIARRIRQRFTFFPKFSHKIQRDLGALLGDVGCNLLNKQNRLFALGGYFDLAEIRVNTTESRFAARLN